MDAFPSPRMLDVDGPLAVYEWAGPPETTFVLVHGLGGSSLSWMRVAPSLAGLGRVLAVDLPGFGRTPLAGRGTGLMELRRSLSALLATLDAPAVVCGNSMGGGVAMLQAAVDPASVTGLVLTGSIFPWAGMRPPHPAVVSAFAVYRTPLIGEALVGLRLRRVPAERMVRLGFAICAARPGDIPPEVIEAHAALLRERVDDRESARVFVGAARSIVRLGGRPDVAARILDAVRCPVLVMHGRRDRLVPVAFARAALLAHPAWRGRIFPDLGHVPQLEAPDRWLAEVEGWHAELGPV
jgi:pimeloyl-ACP methyl ester carboxylesterase